MEVSRGWLYSNVNRFLLPCFPVVRDVLGAHRWAELVRNFLATHRSASPFFRQIPDEFCPISFKPRMQYLKLPLPLSAGARTLRVGRAGAFRFESRPGLGSIAPAGSLFAESPCSKSGARQPELSLADAPYWTAG